MPETESLSCPLAGNSLRSNAPAIPIPTFFPTPAPPPPPTAAHPHPSPTSESSPPFVIEHWRAYAPDGHHFAPRARLLLTPNLRIGGLLAALPGEELKTLIALLTFLTPNGLIRPTVLEVADALQVAEPKVRERLRRLEAFRWQEEPVARRIDSGSEPRFGTGDGVPSGTIASTTAWLERSVPSPALFEVREAGEGEPPAPIPGGMARASAIPITAARRHEVIRRSRARYARPRALVEREILERLGYASAASFCAGDSPADAGLLGKLRSYGIAAEQAESLLARFPRERIERQIGWMGYRQARDPARFLVAAIERDFEAPVAVRLHERQQEDEPAPEPAPAGEADAGTEISSRAGSVPAEIGQTGADDLDGVQLDVPPPVPAEQEEQR